MDFDTLEKVWEKQTVIGAPASAEAMAARWQREIRSARRRFYGMIVMAGGLLILEWMLAIVAHVTGIRPFTALGLVAHVSGSVFYLGWLVLAIRSARAVQREIKTMSGTLRESLGASLRTVELQVSNYRVAAYALPLAVLVTALVSVAKFRSGVLPAVGAATATGFMVAFVAVVALALWRRYRAELNPRRQELKQMLSSLAPDS
jgi:hypothetical protein